MTNRNSTSSIPTKRRNSLLGTVPRGSLMMLILKVCEAYRNYSHPTTGDIVVGTGGHHGGEEFAFGVYSISQKKQLHLTKGINEPHGYSIIIRKGASGASQAVVSEYRDNIRIFDINTARACGRVCLPFLEISLILIRLTTSSMMAMLTCEPILQTHSASWQMTVATA